MYLEKLEIQGFKSFANKNVLLFPGILDKDKRGITAIVGPNGSGKSNVADAVRWALGEQSMKTLRGKKAEDIIFSGSSKKGKLGMAEVSLFLNNEDGVKENGKGIEAYSQIVVTRRLYRNGESGYMINNNRVRLSDVQMLLARAKFGQKTYSVIGQGMVESFLNTTLSERKEFFDEATGVKQYQIKRDDSLNKLRNSYDNLVQTQMLLTEIEPRLKSLTRQVKKLEKRGELEKSLAQKQETYYSYLWHSINNDFNSYNKNYLDLEKVKLDKDAKLNDLNAKLEQLKHSYQKGDEYYLWQKELSSLHNKKQILEKKSARIEAQIETRLEAGGDFDLSFLLNKKEELLKEQRQIKNDLDELSQSINSDYQRGKGIEEEKANLEKEIKKVIGELDEIKQKIILEEKNQKSDSVWKEVLFYLDNLEKEDDIKEIKKITEKLKKSLNKIASFLGFGKKEKTNTELDLKRESIQNTLDKLRANKEAILIKLNENNIRISARREREKLLKEKINSIKNEVIEIEEKIKKSQSKVDFGELNKEKEKISQELKTIWSQIDKLKEKINKVNRDEEKQKQEFFALQQNIQSLQNEINELNNRLQSFRVQATRYETKLEDLEIEIRHEFGDLQKIKKSDYKEIDSEELKQEINKIKHQLELIGGIDPQVEQEYQETKERFEFLSGQVNDFNSAVESLEKIIKELDIVIKKQFDKEFAKIAKNFEKYFKILFNGGRAEIIKVVEEKKEDKEEEEGGSDLEKASLRRIKFLQKHNATGLAGIEVKANPPGKKITSVSMLSGGERALTAVALISAIISANPSPFVVLDEVDAALDEANSERLARILDELSHKTQFIVVTHNRALMHKAHTLYGVTMGDDGVSKLISVKLSEIAHR